LDQVGRIILKFPIKACTKYVAIKINVRFHYFRPITDPFCLCKSLAYNCLFSGLKL